MAVDRGNCRLIAVAIVVAVGAVGLGLVGRTRARQGGRFVGSVLEMKRAG